MHLNVRSLWNKYDQIRQYLFNSNISILGISESWLSDTTDRRLINIPNYTCISNDRIWSENNINVKKGGGTCCYIRSDLDYSDSQLSKFNISSKNIEAQ